MLFPFPQSGTHSPPVAQPLGHLETPAPLGTVQQPPHCPALPGRSHGFHMIRLPSSLPALIRYIRPVFVSRSDQDSRRKTVEEIKRRAQSNGKWPQVTHAALVVFQWFYSERCELREWGGRNWSPSSGAGFQISSPSEYVNSGGCCQAHLVLAPKI